MILLPCGLKLTCGREGGGREVRVNPRPLDDVAITTGMVHGIQKGGGGSRP